MSPTRLGSVIVRNADRPVTAPLDYVGAGSATTRNTRGDGIYVGYEAPKTHPSTGVVINNPNASSSCGCGKSFQA